MRISCSRRTESIGHRLESTDTTRHHDNDTSHTVHFFTPSFVTLEQFLTVVPTRFELTTQLPSAMLQHTSKSIASTIQRRAIATLSTACSHLHVIKSGRISLTSSLASSPRSSLLTRSYHSAPLARFDSSNSPKPAESSSQPFNLESALSELGSNFGDARLDIEDAVESLGTTYYPSDIQAAIDSVNKTLLLFESIQTHLGASSPEATKLRESWSLRLEQLKQELQQAIEQGGGEEH